MIAGLVLAAAMSQADPGAGTPRSVPVGTPLWLEIRHGERIRRGVAVKAYLAYPVYAGSELVLPQGSEVAGTVTGEVPEHAHRIQARLRGDFTPFSKPIVAFTRLHLPDGRWVPVSLEPASDGTKVLHLTPPPPSQGGFIRRKFNEAVQSAKDELRVVTGPDKKERLTRFLWTQVPYHPQYIDKGTVWTADTTADLDTGADPASDMPGTRSLSRSGEVEATGPGGPGAVNLQAYLPKELTSKTAHVGEPVRAIVAAPGRDASGQVVVPTGSVLEGSVTSVKAARRFGRAGELRFDFKSLQVPGEAGPENVQTTLRGVDASVQANLQLGSEGQVTPKPKDKVIVPLLLIAMAGRPLDRDHHEVGFGQNAVASNSLGVVGFIVGTAAGQPTIAAGIGYYGSAIAIWNRLVKRGEETTFPRNTRIVMETTIRRKAPMQTAAPR